MFKALTIAALAVGTTEAHWTNGKKCPKYSVQENFDQSKYIGNWYLIYGDSLNAGAFGSSCTTADYRLKDDGDIHVTNRGAYWWYFG